MLETEMRNPKTTHIDKMTTAEMLRAIQEENLVAVKAAGDALPSIEKAVDVVADALRAGGRLIYMGAGTSGRTGIIDATECPPTFGIDPKTVVGMIAGGNNSVFRSSENAEDKGDAGVHDLKNIGLCPKDVVVGISAAGGAAYVVEAIQYAKSIGCTTVGVTSNKDSLLDLTPDISIVTRTGAEVITGSTRMKAGTAQKLVLNMISTGAMIKMGYVYENLMINLSATNEKLYGRMKRIVSDILDIPEDKAEQLLMKVNWNIKRAICLYKEGTCDEGK